MSFPELIVAETERMVPGKFAAGRTWVPIQDGDTLTEDNMDIQFADDDSTGSRYVAQGIIRLLIAQGEQAFIVTHRGEHVTYR